MHFLISAFAVLGFTLCQASPLVATTITNFGNYHFTPSNTTESSILEPRAADSTWSLVQWGGENCGSGVIASFTGTSDKGCTSYANGELISFEFTGPGFVLVNYVEFCGGNPIGSFSAGGPGCFSLSDGAIPAQSFEIL